MPQFNLSISRISQWVTPLLLVSAATIGLPITVHAQIVGNGDTVVAPNGNQINIESSTTIGANQFFSFDQFNVQATQTAIFQNRGGITNVLAKVSGGLPSTIAGQIQFLNERPNFYLMNPAGILFSANAQLNLPGSFMATTASGIGFGNDLWWDVNVGFGSNNIETLPDPSALRFSPGLPGAIVNFGNIQTNNNLSLIGGTILNTGSLTTASGGSMNLATVRGNTVQLLMPGSPLGLELPAQTIPPLGFNPATLPELLTGTSLPSANNIVTNPDGTVTLTMTRETSPTRQASVTNDELLPAQQIQITAGDIYTETIAGNSERVIMQASGHLYGDNIDVRHDKIYARVELSGEKGIDVGHISLSSAISASTLLQNKQLGWVNLKSSAGKVLVYTIDNPIGRIDITAKGIFQARSAFPGVLFASGVDPVPTSLRSYNGVTIHYNQTVTPPDTDFSDINLINLINQPLNDNMLDIQGQNNAPFVVGPERINNVPVATWLDRGVSGTLGAIEVADVPNEGDPNNNPPVLFRNQSFGILSEISGTTPPPGINSDRSPIVPNNQQQSEIQPNQPSGNLQDTNNLSNPSSSNTRQGSSERIVVSNCASQPTSTAVPNSGCPSSEQSNPSEADTTILKLLEPRSSDR
jgi:filamentous hemagglutinin family protein